jgi:endonuclease-3 related protein
VEDVLVGPLLTIYDRLYACYGDLHWWPAQTAYEVMLGAILTQNTAWSNVEKALANFGGDLSPETVTGLDDATLTEKIRPAGFFQQKAQYLRAVTAWFAQYGYDEAAVCRQPLAKIRAELLAVRGVGPETADSILLYAFGYPTFVVDAYTVRLCARYPLPAGHGYAAVKACFETGLPADTALFQNFHALIVTNAKNCCRKNPVCSECPLESTCGRNLAAEHRRDGRGQEGTRR